MARMYSDAKNESTRSNLQARWYRQDGETARRESAGGTVKRLNPNPTLVFGPKFGTELSIVTGRFSGSDLPDLTGSDHGRQSCPAVES
jgi:hypothetical protein